MSCLQYIYMDHMYSPITIIPAFSPSVDGQSDREFVWKAVVSLGVVFTVHLNSIVLTVLVNSTGSGRKIPNTADRNKNKWYVTEM